MPVLIGQRMDALRQYWKAQAEVSIFIHPVGAMILGIAICHGSTAASTGRNPSGCASINSSVATCEQVVRARFG
jgi:hypothetical protein